MTHSGRIATAALVALVALGAAPRLARAAVTGNIAGIVTDERSGNAIAGVTITVTSPALQGEQVEFTDAGGRFMVTELPPGEYLVRFYFSNIVVERGGLRINADQTLQVNVPLPAQRAELKIYRITEKAPTVDVANSQVETHVTGELVRNTPIAGINGVRNYESVISLAPGSGSDNVGLTFNGASSPENNFMIDGLNTTNPAFGLIGTPLSLEFIGETELITAGYNAEYGRATGGVVNVITKSGSNQFHGGAWLYYTPFTLQAESVARIGEAVAAREHLSYALDFGADLGGPIVKDKIWFYAGFAPTLSTVGADRILRSRLSGMLPAGMTSGDYAGDIDVTSRCPSYLDPALCVGGGYATRDLPGQYTQHFNTDRRQYNWIAKLNFQFDPNNSLSLEYLGNPTTFSGVSTPPNGEATYNGSRGQLLSSLDRSSHDVIGHFISKLLDRKLQLDVLAGYHYENLARHPDLAEGGDKSRNIDQRNSSIWRFEDVPPCEPSMIHGVSFNPCPVTNYADGGYGTRRPPVENRTNQRVAVGANATYFLRLAGTHALRVGVDFEDNIYRDFRYYTGSGLYTTAPDGTVTQMQFGTLQNAGMPNEQVVLLSGFSATTNSFSESLYARDSWNVGFVPGLTLNAGVRFEAQQIHGQDGTTQVAINDNIAPRLGFVYDFTRKGRSKLYANYGRFYESIPLDVSDRSFTQEGVVVQDTSDATRCMMDARGRIDAASCPFPTPPARTSLTGGTYSAVSPVLKGQYTNEVVAGVKYDLGYDLVVGAAYVYRNLGRIIEDLSPDGGNNYIIANPGDATDSGVVQDLQGKIARTKDPVQKANLVQQLSLYQGVHSFAKPTRDYNAMVLTVEKRLSHNFVVLASYTYSRTIGNYPGLYQPTTNQLDPNITSQYDLKELLTNTSGPMRTDRPHNLKLTGAYTLPFGTNAVTGGVNFNVISGRPIDVLAAHPSYGANQSFVLPRGAGGRTPTVTSLDLHLAYAKQLKNVRLEAIWDIFNLLNQHTVTEVDDQYSFDRVAPIANGTIADLAHAKNTGGDAPTLNPNYGRPIAYQAPLSMRFGLRASF